MLVSESKICSIQIYDGDLALFILDSNSTE